MRRLASIVALAACLGAAAACSSSPSSPPADAGTEDAVTPADTDASSDASDAPLSDEDTVPTDAGDARPEDDAEAGDDADSAPDTNDEDADGRDGSNVPDPAGMPSIDSWRRDPVGPAPDYVPQTPPGPHSVTVVRTDVVVPGLGGPTDEIAQASNNNLDVVRFDGATWLAWRTAPDHFASPEARIHVLRSEDEVTWTLEHSFARASDLREPRFAVRDDRLFLLFAELGTDRLSFDPAGTLISERAADGEWSELRETGPPTFIPWRVRSYDGEPMVIGYTGGENLYRFNFEPMQVRVLRLDDEGELQPVRGARDPLLEGGASETDVALLPGGDLWAVARNEAGDQDGFGSKLCYGPGGLETPWLCTWDPRKFDSPLLFVHDGTVYLIGRRNVTETGFYDLGERERGASRQVVTYQADYTRRPKRCALWRIDTDEVRVVFVLDLPSRGDTCFASILPGDDDEFHVYDYTSPLDGPEITWRQGQEGDTQIVRHTLRFERR